LAPLSLKSGSIFRLGHFSGVTVDTKKGAGGCRSQTTERILLYSVYSSVKPGGWVHLIGIAQQAIGKVNKIQIQSCSAQLLVVSRFGYPILCALEYLASSCTSHQLIV
jgi:hypothetical protein